MCDPFSRSPARAKCEGDLKLLRPINRVSGSAIKEREKAKDFSLQKPARRCTHGKDLLAIFNVSTRWHILYLERAPYKDRQKSLKITEDPY